jgi:periplasmic copper chaperone A
VEGIRIVKQTMLALALLCFGCGVAGAHNYKLKSITIDHPFARATPPGAQSGGAFFVVENAGTASDRLLSAASPASGSVELHQMAMDGGVMRMRAMQAIDVPPGGRLELKPGGYHLMLLDLKQPLRAGDTFPLTLNFQNAGTIEVSVEVEAMGAAHPGMHKQ